MSTTEPSYPTFDQIVKGNVSIKKLSKYKYRITFSKIGKFLVYQVWNKDTAMNSNSGPYSNSSRFVYYLSAKKWVKNFKEHNKHLNENGKLIFTPTTIMEIEDYDNYAFVLNKADMSKYGHVVFTVSTKEIKLESNNTSSKNLIKIPCGKFNNVRFDIDAPNRNGGMVVFNKSNCGVSDDGTIQYVRWYCCGGRGPASECGIHGLCGNALQQIASDPHYNWKRDEISCRRY